MAPWNMGMASVKGGGRFPGHTDVFQDCPHCLCMQWLHATSTLCLAAAPAASWRGQFLPRVCYFHWLLIQTRHYIWLCLFEDSKRWEMTAPTGKHLRDRENNQLQPEPQGNSSENTVKWKLESRGSVCSSSITAASRFYIKTSQIA